MSDRMKKIFSFGLPFVSCVVAVFFLLPSCGDNEEIVQRKLEKSYSVDEGKNQLVVEIPCRKAWSLSGAAEWCVPTTTEGRGKTSITVNIAPNGAEESRSCTMQAVSEDTRHTITITQYGAETIVLPVVFHVLYNDRNDSLQYIEAGRLADFLEAANLCYAGEYGGAELNVRFTLATDSPDGEKLAVPGVEYLQRDEYEIDCEVFMTDNSGKYATLLWDPNRYINVFMYQFASGETADGVTLGISHFPYTPIDAYLEGTNLTNYPYITLSNLMYPYSISLNSKCAYESYILMTLSHELGIIWVYAMFFPRAIASRCVSTPIIVRIRPVTIGRIISATWHGREEIFRRKSMSQFVFCGKGAVANNLFRSMSWIIITEIRIGLRPISVRASAIYCVIAR